MLERDWFWNIYKLIESDELINQGRDRTSGELIAEVTSHILSFEQILVESLLFQR